MMRSADDIRAALVQAVHETPFPGLVSLYLFGSVVAGRAHRESDVDLGALLDWRAYPDSGARFEAQLRLAALLSRAVGRDDLDLILLNDAPPGLARHVVTRGVRIVCTAPEVDRAFVRDAQLRAADVDIFLKRTRALKLDALTR